MTHFDCFAHVLYLYVWNDDMTYALSLSEKCKTNILSYGSIFLQSVYAATTTREQKYTSDMYVT